MGIFSLDLSGICWGTEDGSLHENNIFPCVHTCIPCPAYCGVVSSSRELPLMDRIRGNPCFFGGFQTLSDNDAN